MLWCHLVNSNYLPVDLASQSPFDPWGVLASSSSSSGSRPSQGCRADLLIAFFIRSNWWLECVCHEKCDFAWPLFNYSHNKSLLPFICTLRQHREVWRQLESVGWLLYTPRWARCTSGDDERFCVSGSCICPTSKISAQLLLDAELGSQSRINTASFAFWLIKQLMTENAYMLIRPAECLGVKTYRVHE